MFKLTFLGTSSGVPTKNHNVTALSRFATECGLPNLVLTHFSACYDNPEGMAEAR